jgi:hypothetical protein
MQLPRSLPPSEGEGVWVVGLSKGSEADRAGIQQGDQVRACVKNMGCRMCLFGGSRKE